MTIRTITVNNNEYQFINNSRSIRNGFAHDTTLFKNGTEIGRATCHYLNRTWESYTYQTVMKKCIANVDTDRHDRFITNYKAENNIKRLTAKRRIEVDKEFYNRNDMVELFEVYEQLKYNN